MVLYDVGDVAESLLAFLLPPQGVLFGGLDVAYWDVVDPAVVEHHESEWLLGVLARALSHHEGPILISANQCIFCFSAVTCARIPGFL